MQRRGGNWLINQNNEFIFFLFFPSTVLLVIYRWGYLSLFPVTNAGSLQPRETLTLKIKLKEKKKN